MRQDWQFIGHVLFMENQKTVAIEHCFDITDELPLPGQRLRKDSLWIGLVRRSDDFGVQLIFSPHLMGIYRDLSELRTGKTKSTMIREVFDGSVLNQLQAYGLTPETYADIAERATKHAYGRIQTF